MTKDQKISQEDFLKILDAIHRLIPNPQSELDYENPYQLLLAVILSAQTTDKQVNKLTPALFKAYTSPFELAKARPEDIEPFIHSIGLYRNKAKYLCRTGQRLVEAFDGQVPNNRKDLESLPGVGRKTANVVLSVAFDIPAIAVDTHVERMAKAMGVVDESASPLQVEKALMSLLPKERWSQAHQLLVLFGRHYAKARVKDWRSFLDLD